MLVSVPGEMVCACLRASGLLRVGSREGQEGNSSNDNELEMVATWSPRESAESRSQRAGRQLSLLHKHVDASSGPQHPHKNLGTTVCACNPGLGRWRKEDSWSLLAHQWSLISEHQIPELDTISKNKVESD